MPLVVTKNGDATEKIEIGGSTFHFRRCGWGKFNQLRRQCRNERTLLVDDLALDEVVILQYVVGWENVLDGEDQPLEFSQDLLALLPPIVLETLIQGILAPAVKEDGEQGNSASSSST